MITLREFYQFYSPRLGLIRSLLAFGSLITLAFNPFSDLFPYELWLIKKNKPETLFDPLNIFYIGSYETGTLIYFASIIALIFVIIGYIPQVTCILHCWIAYSIYYGTLIVEGGDQITCILSLLLIPICLADKRINHWSTKNKFKYSLNKYLNYFLFTILCFIQLQIAFLYLDAGIEKCKVDEWVDGSAIYYWSNDTVFGASGFLEGILNFLFQSKIVTFVLNWLVILLELTLFSALFMNKANKDTLFIFALIFHLLIFLVHGLPAFSFAMTASLLLLLKPIKHHVYETA